MASFPLGIRLPVKLDLQPVIDLCEIVARHATNLRSDLERLQDKQDEEET